MRPAGYTVSAGHLLGIARDACSETKDGKHDRETGRQKALVSIVFSIATLEAFINELASVADYLWKHEVIATFLGTPDENERKVLQALFAAIGEAEEEHASTKLKYLLAHWVLTGSPFDQGTFPFQDFALLLALRNRVLHLRLETWEFDEQGELLTDERILVRLRDKNILAIPETKPQMSWASSVETHAMARWACNTAVAMVKVICNLIPNGVFKEHFVKNLPPILFQDVV